MIEDFRLWPEDYKNKIRPYIKTMKNLELQNRELIKELHGIKNKQEKLL